MKKLVVLTLVFVLSMISIKAQEPIAFQIVSAKANNEIAANEEVEFDVKVKNFKKVIAFQFSINYPKQNFSFVSVGFNNALNFDNITFEFNALQEGVVGFIWLDNLVAGKNCPDDEAIFSFTLRAKQKTFINEICMVENPIASEVSVLENLSTKSYVPETNGIACTSTNQLAIYSSKILHLDGSPIAGLQLWATSDKEKKITTEADGSFSLPIKVEKPFKIVFDNAPFVKKYIDVLDLYNLGEYILGTKQSSLNLPLRLVADLNLNGTGPLFADKLSHGVSTADFVLLNRGLRGENTASSPFSGLFLDTFEVRNNIFYMTQVDANIRTIPVSEKNTFKNVAPIKYAQKGDVNYSLSKPDKPTEMLYFQMANQTLLAGQTYNIEILMPKSMVAYQMSLLYDYEAIEVLPDYTSYYIDTSKNQVNIVAVAQQFINTNPKTILKITALKNTDLKDVFQLSSSGIQNIAYDSKEKRHSLLLEFSIAVPTFEVNESLWSVGEAMPNPVHDVVNFPFYCAQGGELRLTFTDVSGRVLDKTVRSVSAGNQVITTPISDISATGILYCTLEFEQQKVVKKLIVF